MIKNYEEVLADATWSEGPRWKHDCEACKYLKTFNDVDVGEVFDLYYCDQTALGSTVIARFSSKGPDYMSGVIFGFLEMIRPLHLAYALARKEGYLGDDDEGKGFSKAEEKQ